MKTVSGAQSSTGEGDKKSINEELWQACAGPLVNLPAAGTHVVYFPQGHSEQVAASMKQEVDGPTPNYQNLPSKLLCLLHNVTLLADPETDQVYAQMTLQPVPSFDKDALLRSDLSMKIQKPQTEFFCKTLTASDTSTHGGFSVPRRSAEKIFPPLDFTMLPPAQELVARDLHDNVWTFRHIYRGQPKRHLLTTGWSLFVGGKRLSAGDSVLFIRDEKQQLLLGIRRANRQPTNLSSSVLSSDSMHIGILAAAAHAAANNSPFTVFYNPRASPSEFVIPLAKYYKAVCSNQLSLGMRFRMMFETEESGKRRYMGTITGISDLDPVRWKNSQWRNLQVGWDESTAGEKRNRVSIWEIEPVTAPFILCPTPSFFQSKRPRQPGMPDDDSSDLENILRRTMPWLGEDFGMRDPQAPGMSLVQWMNMQNPSLANSMQQQPNYINPLPSSVLQNYPTSDISRQLGQISQQNNIHFNSQNLPSSTLNPLASIIQPQHLTNQNLPTSQAQSQILQSQNSTQAQNILQQRNIYQNPQKQQQQPILNHSQPQNLNPSHQDQQLHMSENQIQLQLLQKLQYQQQQSLLAQQSAIQQQKPQNQLLDIPQNLSRTNQIMDASQATSSILPLSQQLRRNNSQTDFRFSQPAQVSNFQQHQQPGILSEFSGHGGNYMNPITNQVSAGVTGGIQSAVTDDVPSCSTSPSTNNCPNSVQNTMNGTNHLSTLVGDKTTQVSANLLNSSGVDNFSSNGNLVKDFQQRTGSVNPSVNISKQNGGFFASQPYVNGTGNPKDYLDSSSSATSVLSQNDIQIPQTNNFNSQLMLFRDASHETDPRNNISFGGNNIDNQLGMSMMPDPLITKDMVGSAKDFSTNFSSGEGILSSYENPKEDQPDLLSSMVSESFGVPDIAFNSIDSSINDGSFMSKGNWAPAAVPRLRTYTKVYKRGAVGRVIDITRYSGYNELKQDLARRFGIEGQLEDRHRIGWKLVYVDHENDVLLVGDDPWEEFVNCVHCIKILSPQEVQQMRVDGDFGNNVLPNQACSSSDNGAN